MRGISHVRLIQAMSLGLLAVGIGCNGSGGSQAGSGGTGAGTASGGTTGSGTTGSGSTGSGTTGGDISGSGGTTGSGNISGSGSAVGTGGTPTGTGDAGVEGGAAGGSSDGGADAGAEGGPGNLHGGTSGKYICPQGVNYAGMIPAMSGGFTMSTGAVTNNGESPIWVESTNTLFFTSKFIGDPIRELWKIVLPDVAQVQVKTNVGDNGITLDNDDKIITCDHEMSAIVRLDPANGSVLRIIADQYNGAYFLSPNDVIVRSDGNIYFSDPAYFASEGKRPKIPNTAFYRISPGGQVSQIMNAGTKDPNGVALSPDGNTLYTVITVDQQVSKWALNPDGSINGAGQSFAQTAMIPDGMCVDCAGNVYVSTLAGVQVFDPAGQMVATIGGGKAIACTFGGADRKTLFISSDTHVRWGTMNIPGLP